MPRFSWTFGECFFALLFNNVEQVEQCSKIIKVKKFTSIHHLPWQTLLSFIHSYFINSQQTVGKCFFALLIKIVQQLKHDVQWSTIIKMEQITLIHDLPRQTDWLTFIVNPPSQWQL